MKKEIIVFDNKEFITEVNTSYIFFTFPDGSQDRRKSRKEDLIKLYKWIGEELVFYNRMYEEVKTKYEKDKSEFDNTHHYYSEEEISEACKENRFASIDMKISNKYYLESYYKIIGQFDIAIKASDKYWKLYKIHKQIENAIKSM